MIPVNGKILVRCNMKQKNEMIVGGVRVRCAQNYQTNYRERSPVVCLVEKGNRQVNSGEIIIAHHNTFYTPSPYHLQDDLFAIPFAKTLFAKISIDGNLTPICGNILCDRVDIETPLPIPPEYRKKHIDRVTVTNPGSTLYKCGQLLFTRPHSYYEIVYMWNDIETRIHKVHEGMVVALIDKE